MMQISYLSSPLMTSLSCAVKQLLTHSLTLRHAVIKWITFSLTGCPVTGPSWPLVSVHFATIHSVAMLSVKIINNHANCKCAIDQMRDTFGIHVLLSWVCCAMFNFLLQYLKWNWQEWVTSCRIFSCVSYTLLLEILWTPIVLRHCDHMVHINTENSMR